MRNVLWLSIDMASREIQEEVFKSSHRELDPMRHLKLQLQLCFSSIKRWQKKKIKEFYLSKPRYDYEARCCGELHVNFDYLEFFIVY